MSEKISLDSSANKIKISVNNLAFVGLLVVMKMDLNVLN